MQETLEIQIQSLDGEDPLKESMETHSSIHAWRIPWTQKPHRLQSMGPHRVGHNWSTLACMLVCFGLHTTFFYKRCRATVTKHRLQSTRNRASTELGLCFSVTSVIGCSNIVEGLFLRGLYKLHNECISKVVDSDPGLSLCPPSSSPSRVPPASLPGSFLFLLQSLGKVPCIPHHYPVYWVTL